jgi:hypothetical protein
VTTLHVDPVIDSDDLYAALYRGELVACTAVSAVSDFVEFTRAQLRELFAPHDPEEAHRHLSPEQTASCLGRWKPRFIHDERSKAHVRAIVEEIGFSADETHYDLPKPRTVFPVGQLTTGIAFAFPWHRDTWYAAPPQQINWWLPVFEVQFDNAMKFDPPSFDVPVHNDSASFDYYQVNRDRMTTAKQVKSETQARPQAVDHVAHDELVVLPRPGSILLFSGNHLHATKPNTSGRSRYSVDFRTVDRRHVAQGVGAHLVDVHCSGTALRDFVNIASGERFEEELVRRIHGDPPDDAMLIFDDDAAEQAARGAGSQRTR